MRNYNYHLWHAISQEQYSIWSWFFVHFSPRVIFSFTKIWIFQVVSGGKGQKVAQNDKKSVCCSSCLVNHTSYDFHLWYTILNWYYLHFFFFFFIFFKILIFQVVRRVKGQKMAQNDKKLCLSCLIFQKPDIIWSSFMVHMCKRIISAGFLYIFLQMLIFGISSGVKGQKMTQNDKKLSVILHILGSIHDMIMIFVHIYKMMTSPDTFFIITNFIQSHCISRTVHHIIIIFGTQV